MSRPRCHGSPARDTRVWACLLGKKKELWDCLPERRVTRFFGIWDGTTFGKGCHPLACTAIKEKQGRHHGNVTGNVSGISVLGVVSLEKKPPLQHLSQPHHLGWATQRRRMGATTVHRSPGAGLLIT